MSTGLNLRRSAGVVAVMATTAGGLALANPAVAATGATATLSHKTVTVTGTAARDLISITIDANQLVVDFGADGTVDAMFPRARFKDARVVAGKGDDGVTVTGTGEVPVTISGGVGNDGIGVIGHIGETGEGDAPTTVNSGDGNDVLIAATPGPVTLNAGAGDDRVDGGGAGVGHESVALGAGDDSFESSMNTFVGVRSDLVDGGAGRDSLEVDGTFASESLRLSQSAGHLIVDHNFLDRIDAQGIEDVTYFGFGGLDEGGGGDSVVVNDLSGTGVVHFTPNFSAGKDSTEDDNSSDTLRVVGTAGVDHIRVSGSGALSTVAGLSPRVTPVFLAPADLLVIDTLAGDDVVDSSHLEHGLVQLQVL